MKAPTIKISMAPKQIISLSIFLILFLWNNWIVPSKTTAIATKIEITKHTSPILSQRLLCPNVLNMLILKVESPMFVLFGPVAETPTNLIIIVKHVKIVNKIADKIIDDLFFLCIMVSFCLIIDIITYKKQKTNQNIYSGVF